MILRKPYAFLIKHFKLIHAILALLTFYSIYKTKVLLDFFNEYAADVINVVGQDLSVTLLPSFYKFVPLLIIGLTIVILVVMIVKKKPYLFYIVNIAIYIFMLVVIIIAASTLSTMSHNIIDVRTARLTRDIITMGFLVQFVSAIFISIRAIGFDIKKFDFGKDIRDMDISSEDREEFELQFSFDKNKAQRKIKRFKRYTKYVYKENRLIINIISGSVILILTIIILVIFLQKPPIVNQNTVFSGNGFTMSILDSYLTSTDYKGKLIDEDYYYLILKTKIKNNSTVKSSLDTATTKITIGNYYYIPTVENNERFFDFGEVYNNEKIGNEYENKILLYKIPKQLIRSEMLFSYVNKNSFTSKEGHKSTKVKITYKDLTQLTMNPKNEINDEIEFKKSILPDFKLKISNYDIQTKYKLAYNYCISKECFKSYEYILPTLSTNSDNTLLKIEGNLEYTNNINTINDLYDFIEKFGKISYTIDDTTKTYEIVLKEVKSNKIVQNNIFYIQVPMEVMKANKLSIIFTIRNNIYEYELK